MRVLVTGAGGFIGAHLAARLSRGGHDVWGTYLREEPCLPGVKLLDADILDPVAVASALERSAPDAVVHLAGLSHVGRSWSDPAAYFQANVLGAENVVAAANGTRVIVASSAEVYGAVDESEQPIAESRPLAPSSPYAMSKAALERVLQPLGAVVVRSFNTLGAGQAPEFALPTFARQLAAIRAGRQEAVIKVGNLAARRDFIAIADVTAAYELLLTEGQRGGIYNLGRGEALSIGEALDRLIEASGVEAEIEVDPERFRPVDVPLLKADVSKLRALGWAPTVAVDEALADLWRSVVDLD